MPFGVIWWLKLLISCWYWNVRAINLSYKKFVDCMWKIMTINFSHNFTFKWTYNVYASMKPSSVIYGHFTNFMNHNRWFELLYYVYSNMMIECFPYNVSWFKLGFCTYLASSSIKQTSFNQLCTFYLISFRLSIKIGCNIQWKNTFFILLSNELQNQ